jgi:hypothetical protein
VGKLFAPERDFVISREGLPPEQQPQPGPCDALYSPRVFGALALRSLIACDLRVAAGMHEKCGAVRMARGADTAQCGQSCGISYSDIGRISVKGPQSLQRYS